MKLGKWICIFYTCMLGSASLVLISIPLNAQTEDAQKKKKSKDLLDKVDSISFKTKLAENTSLGFNDIPGFDSIPLPPQLKSKLDKIRIENFELTMEQGEIVVQGSANLFGETLTVKIRQTKKGGDKDVGVGKRQYVFIVDLKQSFKFSDIADFFKPIDDIRISEAGLIISDIEYTDLEWGKIQRGVSFAGRIKIEGRLKKLADSFGVKEPELVLKGTFAPGITGSSLSAAFPGKISFGKGGTTIAETTPLTFTIYAMTEGPAVGLSGGLKVYIPQQDPLAFKAEIEASALKASLNGWMEGMFKFPKVPLQIGDMKAKATIDYATAAASGGLLSLSGFGLGGAISLGTKRVELDIYFEISATTDILAAGEFQGGLYLEDLVALTSEVVKLASKGKVDLAEKTKGKIPHIGLDRAKLYVAPKVMRFGDRLYEQGIEIESEVTILKTTAAAKVKIGSDGMDLAAYMTKINIGPLLITGSGVDQKARTEDDGPLFRVIIDPQGKGIDKIIEAYIDGQIKLDILGGLSASTRIEIKLSGAEFKTAVNIFNKLKARLEGEFELQKPEEGNFTIELEQSALQELAGLMNKGAQEVLKGHQKIEDAREAAQKNLEKAKKTLQEKLKKFEELEDLKNRAGKAAYDCMHNV